MMPAPSLIKSLVIVLASLFALSATAAVPLYTNGPNPLSGITGAANAISGDFDSDGDVDVHGMTGTGPYTAYTYLNNGDGTYTNVYGTASDPFRDINDPTSFGNGATDFVAWAWGETAIADFDGDGDVDIWTPNYNGANYYFENTTGSYYVARTGASNPLNAFGTPVGHAFTIGNFDSSSDGLPDVHGYATPDNTNYTTYTLLNNGAGSFTNVHGTASDPFKDVNDPGGYGVVTDLAVIATYNTFVADFDLDGDDDIFSIRFDSGSTFHLYFENDTGSHYTVHSGGTNPLNALPGAGWYMAGDFDADGDVDVTGYNEAPASTYTVYTMLNNGSGSFSSVNGTVNDPFQSINDPDSIGGGWSDGVVTHLDKTLFFDVDNDGDDEFWAVEFGLTASPYMWRNSGTPPSISSTTPTDNATGVDVNANLVLSFSETISSVGAGVIEIRKGADDSLVESIAGNDAKVTGAGSSTITINPASTLADSTGYYVLINKRGFFDADGMTFQGVSDKTLLNFTTGVSNVAPAISNLNGDSLAYSEGDGAIVIDQGTAATVSDSDSTNFDTGNLSVTISAGEDAAEDVISLDTSGTVALSATTANSNVSVGGIVVGTLGNNIAAGNDLVVNFNASATPAMAQTLLQAVTYENTDTGAPTIGVRTIRFTINDGDGGISSNNDATVTVSAVNDAPTLTSFASVIDTTNEDTEVELTFAELNTQGDEADVDGTVDAYVVQAVSTGSLKIGSNAGAATAYAASTNDTINATNNAYWAPSANANGSLNAFTVKAKDDGGVLSAAVVQTTVSVTAVNDIPTLSSFAATLDTTNEDTEVEITLAEMQAQGDEADVEDGTVSKFVIKAVSTGTLKIGANSLSATAWAATTNDTVDGSNNAYWIPATNASGNLNAFTSVAADSANAQSSTPVQAAVTVSAVNDDPTVSFLPTDVTVTEDTSSNVDLSVSSFADVDSASITVTLTASAGTFGIPADGAGVGGGVTETLVNSTTITLVGTPSDINTYLNTVSNITYTGASNASGQDVATITVTANDGDGSGNVSLGTVNVDSTEVGDIPSVTGATTNEDTQSSSGLVISRNAADSTSVTHFKITSISGGSLYKNDGSTQISDNEFITFAEGNAGLKFTPSANSESDGSFNVQAGTGGTGGGLSSSSATATITVNPVNDAPTLDLDASSGGINYTTSFSAGGSAVAAANSNATVTDVDSGAQITSLVVIITNVQDVGSENLSLNVSATAAAAGLLVTTGTALSVTGSASPATYQSILRGVQYSNSLASLSITPGARTISVVVNDGSLASTTAVSTVNVVTAPVVGLPAASYTEGDGTTLEAAAATVNDPDGDNLNQMLITLTNPLDTGETITLSGGAGAKGATGITATYNSATLITLSGSSSAANYQSVLRELQYSNPSEVPDTTTRAITAQGRDVNGYTGSAATLSLSIVAVNDPMGGSAAITGGSNPPVVGETLSADGTALTDLDGVGAFSYQWRRDDVAIIDAKAADYTLVNADVGAAINVTISYTDGGGTLESSTSSATSAVDGDLDGDGIGDGSDTDIDGDGMLNSYEDAYGLDKWDAADRDSDLDGDGVSNYDESVANTQANVDDYPPVVTPPANVTVNSTGLFTPVTLGTATATDALDGVLTPSSDAYTHFASGVHTVTWSATDAAGNTGEATQTVNVVPMVDFSKDQTTAEGATVTFKVILNGDAVSYPVSVPYTVSGTADGGDHNLVDGTAIIATGTEVLVSFTAVNDGAGEGDESITITMGMPTNAVTGGKTTHNIRLVEGNVAPLVSLAAEQGGVATRIVTQGDGDVLVMSEVTDANVGDSHSYDWGGSDNALFDKDLADETFTFDPSGLTPGLYILHLSVNDGAASDGAELLLNVLASAPVLTTDDSDDDGDDDQTEGYGDEDNDGVPDYLDAIKTPRALQTRGGMSRQYVAETEPGLSMSLSRVAFRTGRGEANVTMGDIVAAGYEADDAVRFNYPSGLFDFTVSDIPVAGQSVNVVLTQLAPIPAKAVYRKLLSTGWQAFIEDDNNAVASAAGAEGFCPSPGDVAYTPGLTEGHWCVQLTIEDGGPNDSDGVANNTVVDPGGVAEILAEDVDVNVSGGGGVLHPLWLLLTLFGMWRLTARQAQKEGE